MNHSVEIIECCKNLDSAAISDALDSFRISGGLRGIKQQVPGVSCIGFAYTVQYVPITSRDKNFKNAADYIDEVPRGSIIVADNQGREDCTVWGSILTHFAIQHGIIGTVINGVARDIEEINELKYPLFSKGIFMQTAKNRASKAKVQCIINIDNVKICPKDLIFCDNNGCVVVPHNLIQQVLARAKLVQQTEKQILSAILQDIPLAEARRKYGYDTPWENK